MLYPQNEFAARVSGSYVIQIHFLKDCLESSGNGKEETCYELENGVGSENLGNLTYWRHNTGRIEAWEFRKTIIETVRGSKVVLNSDQVKVQFLNSEGWPYSLLKVPKSQHAVHASIFNLPYTAAWIFWVNGVLFCWVEN